MSEELQAIKQHFDDDFIENVMDGKLYRYTGKSVMYINWLIETVEELEKENGAMAKKHAEKDLAIRDLMQLLKREKEENSRLRKIIGELRVKTTFKVYEENLALIQEIEWYKEMFGRKIQV